MMNKRSDRRVTAADETDATAAVDLQRRHTLQLFAAVTALGSGLGVHLSTALAAEPALRQVQEDEVQTGAALPARPGVTQDKHAPLRPGVTQDKHSPLRPDVTQDKHAPLRPGSTQAKPIPARPGATQAKPVPATTPGVNAESPAASQFKGENNPGASQFKVETPVQK